MIGPIGIFFILTAFILTLRSLNVNKKTNMKALFFIIYLFNKIHIYRTKLNIFNIKLLGT